MKFRLGILRETKLPPDLRVPFTPQQCKFLKEHYPDLELLVQPSPFRSYTDKEYQDAGISLAEDLSNCDLLMGVKEVNPELLMEGKTYLFFAHVGKKQEHNRYLLKEILRKKITLLDYEYLTDPQGTRLVAFGKWAGIVGAYNGLRGWGIKNKLFTLRPAWQCFNKDELLEQLVGLNLGGLKVLLTGEGRVSGGASQILEKAGVERVMVKDFLGMNRQDAVFCQIGPSEYTRSKLGRVFDFSEFMSHPQNFETQMQRFLPHTDMLITGHFWDPRSPRFFSMSELASAANRVSFIADISCDIEGPVPATLRASSIRSPFYDVNKHSKLEEPAFSHPDNITVMAVDNLPAELPRDASEDFGNALLKYIMDDIFMHDSSVIKRATITNKGFLGENFEYLSDFAM